MTSSTSLPAITPGQARAWRDGKRRLWIASPMLPLFAFVVWGTVGLFGPVMWAITAPVILYVIIPVIDTVVGEDRSNPPESAVPALERDRYYRFMTYVWIPLQYTVLIWSCWVVKHEHLSWPYVLAVGLSLGMVCGISINTGHELGHKTGGAERWLAKIAYAQAFYGHFYIEHNRGHHVRVATPDDPASARLGESLWEFLPRTVIRSATSAWEIEKKRMRRRGYRTFSLRNDFVNSWLLSVVLFAALISVFGSVIVPMLVVQAIYGFCMLETINYVEHYGLLRQRRPDGRYAPTTPRDSWNSNNITSNVFLFHLQRHSDHHANPARRYQSLRHFDQSPQLPSGYATMLSLAYFTPLWRRVMDPRVVAHYGGDVTLANIQPRLRARILRRYGVTDDPAVPADVADAA